MKTLVLTLDNQMHNLLSSIANHELYNDLEHLLDEEIQQCINNKISDFYAEMILSNLHLSTLNIEFNISDLLFKLEVYVSDLDVLEKIDEKTLRLMSLFKLNFSIVSYDHELKLHNIILFK